MACLPTERRKRKRFLLFFNVLMFQCQWKTKKKIINLSVEIFALHSSQMLMNAGWIHMELELLCRGSTSWSRTCTVKQTYWAPRAATGRPTSAKWRDPTRSLGWVSPAWTASNRFSRGSRRKDTRSVLFLYTLIPHVYTWADWTGW